MHQSKWAIALDAGGLRPALCQRLRRGRGPFGNIVSACPRRIPHTLVCSLSNRPMDARGAFQFRGVVHAGGLCNRCSDLQSPDLPPV